MISYPLVQILFWIALISAPHNISQISITAPGNNWIWTKQESGWTRGIDHSVWTVEGSTVTSRYAGKTDKKDVSGFVNGIKEQDWSKTASLQLGTATSLTKTGETFVYTLNKGDPSERQFVIEFK